MMNAVGMLTATFITITGLTERKIPKEGCLSSVFHMSIKGICVGGDQDLRYDAAGYIAFYRKEKYAAAQTTTE